MLESIFVILLIIAIILLILAWEMESLTLSSIDLVLWLVLSRGILQLEIPYQYTSGGTVYTATQTIENLHPLSWLFIVIAIIMMISIFDLAFEMLKGREVKVM